MRNPVKTLYATKDVEDAVQEKAILLYVTTTDEKMMQKVKSWEDSRFTDDKLYVATKFFRCYTLDVAALEKDDPLVKTLKKYKAPSFVVFHSGEVYTGSANKPSASKIYSMLKKSASKLYGMSLDKPVKKALDLKLELDLIEDARKELDKKMDGLDQKNKKLAKYTKEKDELVKKENELKAEQEALYELPKKEVAKK